MSDIPGYTYDGGWRALGPDGQRTRPYICLEAAARARDRGDWDDPNAAPVGWYRIPNGAAIEHCRSCGARIVWTRTEWERAMPLSLSEVREYTGGRYAQSHFANCPDAKEWSKAKRGGPPPRQPQPKTQPRPAEHSARRSDFPGDDEW